MMSNYQSPTPDGTFDDQWGDGLLDTAAVKMEIDCGLIVKPNAEEEGQAAAFGRAFDATPVKQKLDEGAVDDDLVGHVDTVGFGEATELESQQTQEDWRQAGQLWLLLHADKCVGVCHIPQCSTMRQVTEHCKSCTITHCQLSCQQAKTLLTTFKQYQQGGRPECGICVKLPAVSQLWEAQGGMADANDLDRSDGIVQAGCSPNVSEAIDARIIIKRGLIIDKLDLYTPKAEIVAGILQMTGLNNSSTWLDRIAKIDKIRKGNDRYDWMYSDATWTKFQESDAAVRLKKGEPKKEPQPPSTRKRKATKEDAPVKPAELAVDVCKVPEPRQAKRDRVRVKMQLQAAAGMVASLQKKLDEAEEKIGEGQKREMALQKASTQQKNEIERLMRANAVAAQTLKEKRKA
jgi:hypothetical protein